MCKCYVKIAYIKIACLKPTIIWVDLKSLLIYLVQRDSGAPVCNGVLDYLTKSQFDWLSYLIVSPCDWLS